MFYRKNSHNNKVLDGIREVLMLLIRNISQEFFNSKGLLKILLLTSRVKRTSRCVKRNNYHRTSKMSSRILNNLNQLNNLNNLNNLNKLSKTVRIVKRSNRVNSQL